MKNNFLLKTPIAHRGLHTDLIPENTLRAFQNAVQHNYPIELDVRLTKDHEVIVFHDSNFIRSSSVAHNVSELKLSEIKKLKIFSSDQEVPTLKETLKLINNSVPLLIELKSPKFTGILETKVNKILEHYTGEFAIQSFNPKSVRWFMKNSPHINRGFLIEKIFALSAIPYVDPKFLAIDYNLLIKYPLHLLRKKYPILAWTIQSTEDLNKIFDKIDNIIFENEVYFSIKD